MQSLAVLKMAHFASVTLGGKPKVKHEGSLVQLRGYPVASKAKTTSLPL
ncbi:hypothetical protein MTBLM1_70198 [Rhodospirillaceae bacterium LM-1]|nr:hypothetical protein MTBLM1_70198 [Rhodospirillaceae bacterium LM-1]